MFFKNIFVFAFTRPFTTTNEELHALLHDQAFTPLGSTELRHFGWTNSLGKGSNLTTESNGNVLICARSEEKILPSAVVKDAVDEKIEALESEQGRGATKKEREQFKEDVIFELLPRAFNKVNDTHAYINVENNTIVVNSSSRGKAEDLLALLRKTLGTLPVTSLSQDKMPDEVMTEWLTVDSDEKFIKSNSFTIGYEAELHSLGNEAPVIKVKDMALDCEQLKAHLDDDMFVTKIALEYDDIDSDDLNAKIMADFTLMAGELNRMINDLHAEFGDNAKNYLEQ